MRGGTVMGRGEIKEGEKEGEGTGERTLA